MKLFSTMLCLKKDFGDFNKGDLVEELIYDVKKCTLVENKQFIVDTKVNMLKRVARLKVKCKK